MQGRAVGPMSRVRRLRWRGWWWKLPLLAMGVSVGQVLTLRLVDPPFSSFMATISLMRVSPASTPWPLLSRRPRFTPQAS